MKPLILTLGILCLPVLAAAQTVIGTAVVDGRQVDILDDNTWRFSAATGESGTCIRIDGPVSFCGPPTRWQRAPVAPAPAIDALYQVDDRNFGMLIVEGLGQADGLTVQNLREAVLMNAGAAGGVGPEAVPVLDNFDATVAEKAHPTVAYQVTIQGLQFVYLTTLLVEERNAAQLTTYAISDALTDSHRQLHEEFLSHVRLDR